MRQLTLLRHAQAESHSHSGEDVDRPLSLEGRAQAGSLGALLTTRDAVPELALCSPALRARQTWQLASAELADVELRVVDALYSADAIELIELVRSNAGDAACVIVIGHEPVISHVAHTLAAPDSDVAARQRVSTGMSTAMLAFLEFEGSWADLDDDAARLTGLARPD